MLSLLEAAVKADRLERLGLKKRLGPVLTAEELEIKRLEALQAERGTTIGVALRGTLVQSVKPSLLRPRK